MKTVAKIFTIFSLWATLVFPLRANAVVFSPIPAEREENAVKGIMEKGDIVCLFQSGTADVRKSITVNDVLPVYRETKSHELVEVGKIKVLSYVGADIGREANGIDPSPNWSGVSDIVQYDFNETYSISVRARPSATRTAYGQARRRNWPNSRLRRRSGLPMGLPHGSNTGMIILTWTLLTTPRRTRRTPTRSPRCIDGRGKMNAGIHDNAHA